MRNVFGKHCQCENNRKRGWKERLCERLCVILCTLGYRVVPVTAPVRDAGGILSFLCIQLYENFEDAHTGNTAPVIYYQTGIVTILSCVARKTQNMHIANLFECICRIYTVESTSYLHCRFYSWTQFRRIFVDFYFRLQLRRI